MNINNTGNMIKKIREKRNITQAQLADIIHVSDKTISKWETGKGYPDVSLMEPLAKTLGISIQELFDGKNVINQNVSHNMKRMNFYVCLTCGNVMTSIGESVLSCCGITLQPLNAKDVTNQSFCEITEVEDEYCITIHHEMSKSHYISFVAAIKENGFEFIKIYSEGCAQVRFKKAYTKSFVFYCNVDGLFEYRIR